ncbi:MAG: YidC/Oxa1 family membrane protein insertase [Bacilli bacterium]|nr:YidC/Oxa1 family membrane protein insertase [Bacilli bacterium]MDD7181291.1 YidC/Oxa1 family membrane protein insertase [Bacilli bacterium]
MIVFFGIIAAFSLSGCTKSFCTNQDKANQLFAYYGNLYSETLLIDESTKDDFDYSSKNETEEASRVKLIKIQNEHRKTLFGNSTSYQGMTTWYDLVVEGSDKSFLSFMDNKARQFRDDNYTYWMDGTLASIKTVEEAKAVAWHVGMYAGLTYSDETKTTVTGVAEPFTNTELWFNEAVKDPDLGLLKSPSFGFIETIKTNAAIGYNTNTACITPVSGTFNQNNAKIYIEGKTWGQAFKEYGFLEGLFVYPFAWLVHAISDGLGGTGWVQIFAIFVVTILVRIVTVLSTLVQSKSQAKQQRIQPQINELMKKYPNAQEDPEERRALSLEQAQLMKKNHVHPMLPLLFMIIQFPLFICIWSALQGSASLASGNWYGLSLTTKVSECFTNYAETNGAIVGILIFIFMSLANVLSSCTGLWINNWKTKVLGNQSMQPTKKDANGNPMDPNKTMKIMTYVMMAFVLFMGWSLPVGMGIYWFIGAIISILQSLLTEAIQARVRHRDAENTGDGTTLAAIRRSARHTGTNKKSEKPLWRK